MNYLSVFPSKNEEGTVTFDTITDKCKIQYTLQFPQRVLLSFGLRNQR